jgi:hypothetical protein
MTSTWSVFTDPLVGEVVVESQEQVEEEDVLPPPCLDLTEYPLKIGRPGFHITHSI